jgi:glutathione peroxidase
MALVAALLSTGALLSGSHSAARFSCRRAPSPTASAAGAYGFSARDLRSGDVVDLAKYEGKVSLIVNVASKWGLTDSNYRELQALYQQFGAEQFEVLAFPCNQFGGQEPGSPKEILDFVSKYGVTFPLFEKVDVNGPNTHPLFKYLKEQKGELLGDDVKWNFGKFLVGKDGSVLSRYAPTDSPSSIASDVEQALAGSMKGVVTPTNPLAAAAKAFKLPF